MTLTADDPGVRRQDPRALHPRARTRWSRIRTCTTSRRACSKLDFLVVQDIFLTETAQLADVVLPGVTFAEKLGTFTNTERRVQLTQPAITPTGNVRQDYEIIADLAARFGHEFPRTPEGLFQEIRDLTPSYAGHHLRADPRGRASRGPARPRTTRARAFLHVGKFARGLALLTPLEYRPPAEEPDAEYDLVLSTGRILRALPHRQHDPPLGDPRRHRARPATWSCTRTTRASTASPTATGWR